MKGRSGNDDWSTITEMEGIPYNHTLRGFEMNNIMDNMQVLRTFRVNTTNKNHLPRCELSAVVFLIIATIFDIWLVRKHELSFCPFKYIRWLHAFCLAPLSAEDEHFRWLMSTLVARLNHRILLFCQFLDRTKTHMSFGIILEKQTL
jgi:hypothetical protein